MKKTCAFGVEQAMHIFRVPGVSSANKAPINRALSGRKKEYGLRLWLCVSILACGLLTGCASQVGGDWGAHTTLTPGWEQIKSSALSAAKSPHTWVPVVGAAVFAIGDLDEDTLEWATDHNPIFGNIDDAKDWSDDLAVVASVNWLATGVMTPSGESHYWENKARGLGLQALTLGVTRMVTNGMKSAVDRERPDRPDKNNSFPSLHTSAATAASALAARNIEHLDLTARQKKYWQVGSYALAGLTGWARIEANRHYPSDVLFGYALGHFLAAFINDAFIIPAAGDDLHITVDSAGSKGLTVGLNYYW